MTTQKQLYNKLLSSKVTLVTKASYYDNTNSAIQQVTKVTKVTKAGNYDNTKRTLTHV